MNAPLPEAIRQALASVSLDDKYTLERGRAYMSGIQALVRLPLLQAARDRAAGLNTGGFISGYRGSPLGALDQALWKAKKHLAQHNVVFQPGVNEDLGATAVWGTQQVALSAQRKVDGVFSLWYGKGPGVDRSLDVLKHANAAGSSRYGGVLALAGDDHGCKSSTLPHQSDHVFKAASMPVLFPATVQEYLDLGLHGWAMSRYSGLWVGVKCVTDVVEASASVIVDPDRVQIQLPQDFILPPEGLNIRWPDTPLEQEARLLDYKAYAALAYVRANRLNYNVIDSPHARFGIITTGKSYLDTMQALADLGLDADTCSRLGIRVHKVGMVWPLEATLTREFAEGLEEILVVEEKRQLIEYQLKEELYNWREDVRPRIFGKFDEKDGGEWSVPQGNWLLPVHYELSPAIIAKAIASRLEKFELPGDIRARIQARLGIIEAKEKSLHTYHAPAERKPYYCSGCPHNTSTQVPEGSRALAGIGCHYMAIWMPDNDDGSTRRAEMFSQMGGEGVPWIGQAPFTNEAHVFANLGDGTYFHSGTVAIRAAIAAGVNITYKILYNDAVAMTGGQPVDGVLTVPQIVRQMQAEGAKKIVIVTDEPEKYQSVNLGADVPVHHRDDLLKVERELRAIPGCTILIYDQTCASEKRRRRKKIINGQPSFPDPAKRAFINEAVCEGCGDCSVKSNCLSVEPLDTEFGRKRQINQSSCNKDYSCVNGFCPSFVTIEGGGLKKPKPATGGAQWTHTLPEPAVPGLESGADAPYRILITGVGGTGVVTIGQLLGMASHLEGKGVSVLDMAGLAQKGGSVFSHVQIASSPQHLHATRIAMGEANLIIGGDAIVSASADALQKTLPGKTQAVINSAQSPTADFVRNPDWTFPAQSCEKEIEQFLGGAEFANFVNAQQLAVSLLGDAIYANPLLLGWAWQKGWVPLHRESLLRAIELNGVSIEKNQQAFEWGRRAAHDLAAVEKIVRPAQVVEFKRPQTLQQLLETRVQFLTQYQNAAYAKTYADFIKQVQQVESEKTGTQQLTQAVARYLFKLMAYKDEYEVARLHSDPAFLEKIRQTFEGDYKLVFHLAPPLLARKNDKGELVKRPFGAWMLTAFKGLSRLKFLRGTAFDLFGYTAERRMERQLIVDYKRTIEQLLTSLNADNLALCTQVARIPEEIRGYGHVKEKHWQAAKQKEAQLLLQFHNKKAA